MTRPIRNELLEEEDATIIDEHLRNHLHLTNCIHVKNHIHRLSPNMTERSLLRDLIMLQRSKSLRDPSTSPTPWHSPHGGRRSLGIDRATVNGRTDLLKTLSEQMAESAHLTDSEELEPFRTHRHAASLSGQTGKGKSNPLTQVTAQANGHPKNACGLPWSWSKIHDRGKTIIDKAGKSLSCGLTESTLRRNGAGMEALSDHTSSSACSDSESFPLLIEPSRSKGGTESSFLSNNHSHSHDQHQSLTQKYAPNNFRDLMGQNLVVQALSNAVVRGKIGMIYVFYGPHGTGKTSCAWIFARAINCKAHEHPKPCGTCVSCISHDLGKNRDIVQLSSMGNSELEGIYVHLEKTKASHSSSSRYRVFILDDCDTLSANSWNSMTKVIEMAPGRVVFILITSSVDSLPHVIISRCQKFFFPKLKDAEITRTLQQIAVREGLEIDKDALRLIASRSDGSLRDAEMTLEQLSLLGQHISITLVQELAGLISDEKLVDLLDLALSADTVNTVKRLKDVMEAGVEPLALLSQIVTIITDILAGSYVFPRERLRTTFFRRQKLFKEDMDKLRHALKALSEAEKQLRSSNDKWTWLMAAMLQLAPHQQFTFASPTVDHSQRSNDVSRTNSSPDGHKDSKVNGRRRHIGLSSSRADFLTREKDIQKIWGAVLEKIQVDSLKTFMLDEGKLTSVSFGFAPTVQLTFSSRFKKSKAEKFRGHILRAFESVLSSPVTLEIRCESRKDEDACGCSRTKVNHEQPTTSNDGHWRSRSKDKILEPATSARAQSEIMEAGEVIDHSHSREGAARRQNGGGSSTQSIVKGKVSLAHVIHQAEGRSRQSGWSRRKAVSIAEKLEQENLRLEPRSRSLLCWGTSKITRGKAVRRLRIRPRKRLAVLKNITWGRCLRANSPRGRGI